MIHDTIKQRLRTSLLGSSSGKQALDAAAHLAGELTEGGYWREAESSLSRVPDPSQHQHLVRTMRLAKAQHLAPGELGGATRRAFDWWLCHDFRSADWHQDQIAVPRLVGEIALLCEGDLSLGAWGRIIEVLARARWSRWISGTGWTDWTGAALLGVAYNVILRGCLEGAPLLCEGAFRRAFRQVHWLSQDQNAVCTEEATNYPLPEPESLACIRDYARLVTLAHGTPLQAPVESIKSFVAYLLDFQQWMMWRHLPYGETPAAHDLRELSALIAQLAQLGNPPRRVELANMADRLDGRGEPLYGHRYFWRSFHSIHQRPDFYCSLALHIPEVPEAAAPGQRQRALSGELCLLRAGREHVANVGHAVPVPAAFRQDKPPFAETIRTVGGVGDGEFGLAASGLRTDGEFAHKAWFFFDQSTVCLSAGSLGLEADRSALSQINRCHLDGPVTVVDDRDTARRRLDPAQCHHLSGVRRIEHGGFLYYFPDAPRLTVNLEAWHEVESTASGSPGLFSLCIDHEPALRNAASVCLILPSEDGTSRTGTQAETSQIEVLANHRAMQAVRHRGLGIVGVTFWEPSVLVLPDGSRIAANSPCLLLHREDHGSPIVHVAGLLRRAVVVHVECRGRCVCFELPGGMEAGRGFSRRL